MDGCRRSRPRSLLCLTSLLLLSLSAAHASAAKKVRVALVLDRAGGDAGAVAQSNAIMELAAGERAFELEVPADKVRAADGTIQGLRSLFDELAVDRNVDLIVALDPLGSHEALRRGATSPKPLIAASVLDPRAQKAPAGDGGSGQRNLTYVGDPDLVRRELAAMAELGKVRSVALCVGQTALAAIEGLGEGLEARAKDAGLAPVIVPVDAANVSGAANAIPRETDVVYLVLLEEIPRPAFSDLLRALGARRLRTFATRGIGDVEAGALAGLASSQDAVQRARRVAIDVIRIASGEPAGTLPVGYQRPEALTINAATARAIGWEPPFEILGEAEIVGEMSGGDASRKISIKSVVEEVLAANLDLESNRHEVEAGAEDEEKALSLMLPQFEVSARGVAIDDDRAAASFGTQPQRQFSVVLDAKSVLFSDKLLANLGIQRRLANLRGEQREALKLDLTLEAVRAFVGVLQTRVLERIRSENGKRTRANLRHARIKGSEGSAGPSEVLRWESQLALDRREVLKARSLVRLAEIQLNRLAHRPLEERFSMGDEGEDQALLDIGRERLGKYLDSEAAFAKFREFVVAEGLEASPELRALDEAIGAAERAASAAWRTLWVPTLAIAGQGAFRIAKGGKGSEPPSLPPMLPPEQAAVLSPLIPPPIGDFTWQIVGLASLPIPIDTGAFADIRKAEAEIARRVSERSSVREKIEQRIRSAAHQVGASYPGVALARASAEAARKNFMIASDAYGTGVLGVVDLVDAQNLALVSEQAAVSAQYDFIIEQIQLERAVGSFLFLKTKEERDAWFERLFAFMERG